MQRKHRNADIEAEIITKFLIIHRTSDYPAPKGKDCLYFYLDELVQIASDLGISQNQIRTSLINHQKMDLCNLIKQKLTEIGHII